jgi:ribosomal protein S19E (S16A)
MQPRFRFGVDTLCRYCKGQGVNCAACGGVGFTSPPPSHDDENSMAAAASIESVAGRTRAQVHAFIQSAGGATEQEIERGTGIGGNTVRPRLRELEDRGLIRKAGKGVTASGRSCWRYEAVSEARAA